MGYIIEILVWKRKIKEKREDKEKSIQLIGISRTNMNKELQKGMD